MSKRIIFPNANGIAVIYPVASLPIDEIARKDVPVGVPYLIIEDTEIPAGRTLRDACEADFSNPHGYGSDYGVGTLWDVTAYDNDGRASALRHKQTGEVKLIGEQA